MSEQLKALEERRREAAKNEDWGKVEEIGKQIRNMQEKPKIRVTMALDAALLERIKKAADKEGLKGYGPVYDRAAYRYIATDMGMKESQLSAQAEKIIKQCVTEQKNPNMLQKLFSHLDEEDLHLLNVHIENAIALSQSPSTQAVMELSLEELERWREILKSMLEGHGKG